jgi:hypothetical protein
MRKKFTLISNKGNQQMSKDILKRSYEVKLNRIHIIPISQVCH